MDTISVVVPSAAERSLPRRILDTVVSPGELFATFGEHAPWIGPLVVTIVLTVASVLVVPEELFVEQARISTQGLPAEPDPAVIAAFARTAGAVALVVTLPLISVLQAGVLTLVFAQLMGGEAGFRQHLAVVTHAGLIPALGALVTLPIQLALGDLEVRLSLSLLTPFLDPDGLAFAILDRIDLFTVWSIVLIGLGVHVLNRKPSWPVATGILLSLFLAVIGITTALAR